MSLEHDVGKKSFGRVRFTVGLGLGLGVGLGLGLG